ncbi:hypothetical protein HDU76_014065 [Blyttiomyces sp. JEL0837]|nr:hypothetical protein HDU76_014065 [Blyttiomyces sp. JEL0837]
MLRVDFLASGNIRIAMRLLDMRGNWPLSDLIIRWLATLPYEDFIANLQEVNGYEALAGGYLNQAVRGNHIETIRFIHSIPRATIPWRNYSEAATEAFKNDRHEALRLVTDYWMRSNVSTDGSFFKLVEELISSLWDQDHKIDVLCRKLEQLFVLFDTLTPEERDKCCFHLSLWYRGRNFANPEGIEYEVAVIKWCVRLCPEKGIFSRLVATAGKALFERRKFDGSEM